MNTEPAFVLVHGGFHGSWAWGRMIPHLQLPSLAVDLPGRGDRPADLNTVTIRSAARSVAQDVTAAGLSRVVLVGHSLAGVLLPVIADEISAAGAEVERLVFLASLIAADGRSSLESMPESLQERSAERLRELDGAASTIDMDHHREQLCNDMTPEQEAFTLSRLVPDTMNFFRERVDWGASGDLPRTYIRLARDRSLSPDMQDHMIGLLGVDTDVVRLDTGHNVMISDPPLLAACLESLV